MSFGNWRPSFAQCANLAQFFTLTHPRQPASFAASAPPRALDHQMPRQPPPTLSAADLRLQPATTGLLVVDIQERLVPAMLDQAQPCIANVQRLIEGLGALQVRALCSEQYPKGLGHTVPALAAKFAQSFSTAQVVEKTEFSAAANPQLAAHLQQWQLQGVRSVLVAGMEAHICVYQTVRGLVEMGFVVHVVQDACASRTEANIQVAAGLWRQCGAVVTSTETVLFDLLGQAGGEAFKLISKLIR